jgi:hypothetical protein
MKIRWFPPLFKQGSQRRLFGSSKLQLRDVFTPGGLPSVTYVGRDHLELETKILDAVARGYSFNVVTGPTKSGKSVLCSRVLAPHNPVVIEGGGIRSEEDFWAHLAYYLKIADSATRARATGSALKSKGGVEAGGLGLKSAVHLEASGSDTRTASLTYRNVGMLAAIERLLEAKRALIVDDFHFIDPAVQKALIRSLKGAVFKGLPVFLLAVPHRAFDPVTVENEVEGRFKHISIPRWSPDDLLLIPRQGFPALNVMVERAVPRQICENAFGNPLLVQEICSELCLKNGIREHLDDVRELGGAHLEAVYKEMAENKGFPLYERLKTGPRDGGRQLLEMHGGGHEEIHTAIMAAVARLGPKNDTTLDEIRGSLQALLSQTAQVPSVDSLNAILVAISRTARQTATGEPPIEWMEQESKLAIIDPFLLFYLKWTFKDQRSAPSNSSAVSGPGQLESVEDK